MTMKRDEKEGGGKYDPKEGANSGVGKSSSTVADEGPVTTQATPEGDPIVNPEGHVEK